MKYFFIILTVFCLGNTEESNEQSKCLKSMKRVRAKRKAKSFSAAVLLLDQKSIAKVNEYGKNKISEKLGDQEKITEIVNFFLSASKKEKIESHEGFKDNLKRLKSLRYVLKQMRFIAVMVSVESSPPKALDSFARKLGKIEDQIKLLLKSTDKNRKAAIKGLLKATETVNSLLKKRTIRKILFELGNINLVEEEDFRKKISSEVRKISAKIKEDPSVMSAHEFHVCRIRLGKLQTIANIGSKITSNKTKKNQMKALASYIQSLYLIMGKIHDLYVRRSLETSFNYRRDSITMDTPIRRELAAFVSVMTADGDSKIEEDRSSREEDTLPTVQKKIRIYSQENSSTGTGVFD